MHAVPSPPTRWLLNQQEEKALREKEENYNENDDVDEEEDEDLYDDYDEDYDDYDEEVERSVLLFNTWPDDEPGPRGVNGDIATGALPEGIELSEEDSAAYLKSQEESILREWEEDYGKNGEEVRCNNFSEWKSVSITTTRSISDQSKTTGPLGPVNVSLMGRENRRLYPKKYASLYGPTNEIGTALTQLEEINSFLLLAENDQWPFLSSSKTNVDKNKIRTNLLEKEWNTKDMYVWYVKEKKFQASSRSDYPINLKKGTTW